MPDASPADRLNRAPNAHRRITKTEKALIAQAVAVNPTMTRKEVTALAKTMRRSPQTIQREIEAARGAFMGSAGEWVEKHKAATFKALDGDPDSKGFSEALRQAQWAITQMAEGGVRITEKDAEGNTGTKIMIGVKVGGTVTDE